MNFQEIVDHEYQMLMEAEAKYGKHFKNCLDFISLAQDFISEAKIDSWIFNALLAHIRKHLVLSFFSVLRLHHIQTFADLRQVLEGVAMACYALAFPESKKFLVIDQNGLASNSDDISKGFHYKWLEENYPDASLAIKRSKDHINKTCAHCNLTYAMQFFKISNEKPAFEFSFFDKDDPDLVKGDLWFVGHTAGNLMDIFYGVNKDYKLLTFPNDFINKLREFRKIKEEIKIEMMEKERFKKWKFILEDR